MIDAARLEHVRFIRKAATGMYTERDIFRAFATAAACAVAYPNREEEYLSDISRYDKKLPWVLQDAFKYMVEDMDKHLYADVLGPAYMELVLQNNPQGRSGEFYTPPPICKLMAMTTLPASADEWYGFSGALTACEPACGSGGMIMASREVMAEQGVAPHKLHWTAIDISRTAADMCYVNMSLYGIPGVVVHGNALSNEIFGSWRTRWPSLGSYHSEHPPRLADGHMTPDAEPSGNGHAPNAVGPLTRAEMEALIRKLIEGGIWRDVKAQENVLF